MQQISAIQLIIFGKKNFEKQDDSKKVAIQNASRDHSSVKNQMGHPWYSSDSL